MTEQTGTRPAIDPSFRPMMRSLAIEVAISIPIVTAYFLLVISLAKDYLVELYYQELPIYSIVATAIIVLQGVLLEVLTSWLIRRFGLRH